MNHLGDEARARKMLTVALASGVDSVTFQVREAPFYEPADRSPLRLPDQFYREAAHAVHEAGRLFGMAICDPAPAPRLGPLGVDFWKTLSWDLRNETLRAVLESTGKPIFFSTGLASSEEVREVGAGLRNATLIHTQLSQDTASTNLKAIATMKRDTGLPVAFGLHCRNHDVLKLALAFEPAALFFYVRDGSVEKSLDHDHAIPMDHLGEVVSSLRELMAALGTGVKEAAQKPAWVPK